MEKERKVKVPSHVWPFVTLWTVAYQVLCPWDFPGKGPGMGLPFLLQRIFPAQGSNLGLLHCRQMLYHLSHQGSQRYISRPKAGCRGFPGGASGKESACQCKRCKRCEFDPWFRKITWSRKWQPIPVFLPTPHRQRSLASYSPWGFKESDMTEHTHTQNFKSKNIRWTNGRKVQFWGNQWAVQDRWWMWKMMAGFQMSKHQNKSFLSLFF